MLATLLIKIFLLRDQAQTAPCLRRDLCLEGNNIRFCHILLTLQIFFFLFSLRFQPRQTEDSPGCIDLDSEWVRFNITGSKVAAP